jgi:hypothetical protein
LHMREILEETLGVVRHDVGAACRDQLAKTVAACQRSKVVGDEYLKLSRGRPLT